MKINGVDFETARDDLAEELGLDTGRTETAAERNAREEKQRRYKEKREKEIAAAKAKAEEEAEKAANYDFTAYYRACRARLDDPEALAYLNGRGISKETAYNCFIGYDPQADPASVPGAIGDEHRPHPCKRLIIPTSKRHYVGRRIDGQKDFDKVNPKGCSPGIFNKSRLAADVPAVFVCEGAFDALSVEEAGAAAVALNSASNTGTLLTAIREKPTAATLVLCLDNDGAGESAAMNLQESLRALGVHYICANIAGDCKDPNEALQTNREAFIKAVKDAQEQARAYRKEAEELTKTTETETADQAEEEGEEMTEKTAQQMQNAQELQEDNDQEKGDAAADQKQEEPKKTAEELAAEYRESWRKAAEIRGQSFLQAITTEKYKPIPTGIKSLDSKLGGGFMRQWLVTLGAPPGAGKTALAQWIFEGMAERGNTCLYFNAEMSREQLTARSLAKIIFEKYNTTITTPQILQGYQWSDNQREKVEAAVKEYTEKIAPFMCYNPEPKDRNGSPAEIHQIIKIAQAEADRATAAGLDAPILIIDYLQLIEADGQEDKAEIIKTALRLLKGYAIKYNTIVFVITAHKRDGGGASTMESGRDTSNIEYSADLLLGLDFTACLPDGASKGKSFSELKPWEREKKTLVIHKSRFSEAPAKISLLFNGEHMTFKDLDTPEAAEGWRNEEPGDDIPPIFI
jgi:DNA primase